MREIVGRKAEREIIQRALESDKSELLALYGRRRVGKTFLVRAMYEKRMVFEFSGLHKLHLRKQLKRFFMKLKSNLPNAKQPTDWQEAFDLLGQYIDKLRSKKKKVIFIDEFPWIDTTRSYSLSAFDDFWNNYASKREDLVVVICGSAASYIINNILADTGGLHNRITQTIKLLPFNLHETELMLKKKHLKFSRYEIAQLYMAMGGVPFYLEMILPGESVP